MAMNDLRNVDPEVNRAIEGEVERSRRGLVAEAINGLWDEERLRRIRDKILELVDGFPLYPGLTVLG